MPMRPGASPSSMDHRAPPPELQLQLPSAVVPVKKRRTPRSPKPATIPAPPPAAFPAPSAPRQIPAPPAAAGAADAHNLMLLAHTAVSQADAEAEASSPPPAPAPTGDKLRSSPPLPLAAAADEEKEKPYAPLLPPLAVDHQNPSSMSTDHGHAATKASAADCKKAACLQPQGNAGSSKGDQHGGGVASPAAGAGASPPQPGDDEEELELGEIPPEKPAAGCNADSAHESLLGKEETAAGEEAKTTIAGEPAATGSSAHRAPTTVMVGKDGEAATEMSAAEEKRMREVFVGGLSRDAREEDVRAALSAAGEITQVRMIKDRTNCRNNKGYCFVAYRESAMASKAVAEFGNVKICGKPCRVAVPEGNEKTNKIAQRDPIIEDYNRIYEQRQPSPTLAVHSSYITSWDHHARHENNTYAIPASSYVVSPVVAIPAGYYYPMYHNGNSMYLPPPDLNHGLAGPSGRSQMGQSGSCRQAGQPHRSRN